MSHALNSALSCVAEVVFNGYIRMKEEEAQTVVQRREDVLARKLVETGKVDAPVQSPRRSPRKVSTAAEPKTSVVIVSASRSHQNESIVWSHFHARCET